MKQALKEVFAETLHEQREFLHEVFADVLEDFALTEAIHEGRQTELVERAMVFEVLEDRSQRPPVSYGSRACTRQRKGREH